MPAVEDAEFSRECCADWQRSLGEALHHRVGDGVVIVVVVGLAFYLDEAVHACAQDRVFRDVGAAATAR